MDNELKELYQQVILDHNKSPRNFGKLEHANHDAEGYNPLCGDKINVYVDMDDDIVKDISFQSSGCAISRASASLMSSFVKGKTREEAEKIFNLFHDMIIGKLDDEKAMEELGKLAVFTGVKDFPSRVKCASLPWYTLMNALHNKGERVTTE
jgi:nitrogen fixation NifU-like protein